MSTVWQNLVQAKPRIWSLETPIVFEYNFNEIDEKIMIITHCGLVKIYGITNLGQQYWFSQWFVAWEHQAIFWTNVD